LTLRNRVLAFVALLVMGISASACQTTDEENGSYTHSGTYLGENVWTAISLDKANIDASKSKFPGISAKKRVLTGRTSFRIETESNSHDALISSTILTKRGGFGPMNREDLKTALSYWKTTPTLDLDSLEYEKTHVGMGKQADIVHTQFRFDEKWWCFAFIGNYGRKKGGLQGVGGMGTVAYFEGHYCTADSSKHVNVTTPALEYLSSLRFKDKNEYAD